MNYFFLGTKGLNIREISTNKYIIEDVFGQSSLPYKVNNFSQLIDESYKIAKTIPLITDYDSLFFDLKLNSSYLYDLEKYYICRLCDSYRVWQCGTSNYRKYDLLIGLLPIAYVEYGYSRGSKEVFELIHQQILKLVKNDEILSENVLNLHLRHLQLQRICDDIVALLNRAIYAFKNILDYQRKLIREHSSSLISLKSNEIIHKGKESYEISTSATIAVISLCTSLDISTQLIDFLNNSITPVQQFKPSQGKQYKDLKNIKPNVLLKTQLNCIRQIWAKLPHIKSLIQFRHDLIHKTTALELEKIYIGMGTKEICNLPMHYSFQAWRDCDDNGQPHRFLGRDYFTGSGIDFEKQLNNWITDVIQGHLLVGEKLGNWVDDQCKKVDFSLDF
ncbi:MAG: hypothetical protein AB4041_09705 [Microcystaceae cyanobacterium]